ncbi:MAG TPA: cysteine peptidase family C39 domain-containing protein, partial [Daejeonella sp.]
MTWLKNKRIRNSFFRQVDRQDCGIACLMSVIWYFNVRIDYSAISACTKAKSWGLTMLDLKRFAQQAGFTARGLQMSPDDLHDQTSPVILHTINSSGSNHFIVYYSYNKLNQTYLIGDPATGVGEINSRELDQRWQSRAGLLLLPDGNAAEAGRNGKWRWLLSLVHYEKFLLALVTLLGLLTAVMGLSLAIYLQVLTDKILPVRNYQYMITGLVMLATLFIVRSFIVSYRQQIVIAMVKDFNSNLVREFTRHLQKLPDYFLNSKTTGDMVVRFNDTQNIQFAFSTAVSLILIDMVMLIAVTGFVFSYSIPVAISIIIFIALTIALAFHSADGLKEHQQRLTADFCRTDNILISAVNDLKERGPDTNFDLDRRGFYDFVGSSEKFSTIVRKLSLKFEIMGAVFFAGIIIYSSFLVIEGHYSKGQFLA